MNCLGSSSPECVILPPPSFTVPFLADFVYAPQDVPKYLYIYIYKYKYINIYTHPSAKWVHFHQAFQVPKMEVPAHISCMYGLYKGKPTPKIAGAVPPFLVPEIFGDI